MSGQMLELGHAQVGDGDEVRCCAEPASGALGLLQQTVHRLDEGVGSVVDHSPYDGLGALGNRARQLLERLEPATPGPAQPGAQVGPGELRIVAGRGPRIDLAQRHLQPPRPRTLQARMLQPVHRIRLLDRPAVGVLAHAPHLARVECSIKPKHFNDLLTLIKVDGHWQIISKVFHYELEPVV